jgi:hypothetical protein
MHYRFWRLLDSCLAAEEVIQSRFWRPLLHSDPMFKWVENYPVVAGFHRYRNESIYRKWEAAEPQQGFVKLFIE